MTSILIVDDEKDIVNVLKVYLSSLPAELLEAYNGKQALEVLSKKKADLILMDVMMPEMDGISTMAAIRKQSSVPIILLTAKGEDSDKILGLDLGADDYITKPFNPGELVARVKSVLRRSQSYNRKPEQDEIVIGPVILNDQTKSVTVDGAPVSLTPMEFSILKLLMSHPNCVYSSARIYQQISGLQSFGSENSIAVHIRHIREKIEINPAEPRYLKVVWGQGYCMEKKDEK